MLLSCDVSNSEFAYLIHTSTDRASLDILDHSILGFDIDGVNNEQWTVVVALVIFFGQSHLASHHEIDHNMRVIQRSEGRVATHENDIDTTAWSKALLADPQL